MDNRTNELLQKYHRNELRSEELKELVEGIRRSTDEDLRSCLEEHWATYEGFADLSEEKRQRLFPLLEHHGQKTWLNGWRRYWLPVAASVLLLLSGSLSVLYLTQYQEMQTLAERNIEIRSGEYEPSMVVLPDGTRVRLNARSVLSYHQDFGTDMRHVQLSGEGFFEVRHDASRPFYCDHRLHGHHRVGDDLQCVCLRTEGLCGNVAGGRPGEGVHPAEA